MCQVFQLPPDVKSAADLTAGDAPKLYVQAAFAGCGQVAAVNYRLPTWVTVQVFVFSDHCWGVLWNNSMGRSFALFTRLSL